ncbi:MULTISPECIES: hypothetical protein [unclassified Modestobacter]|uniref:hypothetical protein n=1 Tax=unclassified Modestobacter TaxID=2643866 RepID=UPI0022AAE384|nr:MULTISPECIES: hypothetical protein [unclassified Modestobacter]MCZ2826002.1 hypothetical protein [Modestobacter sp. VKM Ac-2981]MCZ2852933.1 hypothetical protein [Modestobacter sp. VKM Ac-2982]
MVDFSDVQAGVFPRTAVDQLPMSEGTPRNKLHLALDTVTLTGEVAGSAKALAEHARRTS